MKPGSIAAPKIRVTQLRRATIGPTFALLVRSICRPFRANLSGRRFPGLKPWAESSSPFGAQPFGPRHEVPEAISLCYATLARRVACLGFVELAAGAFQTSLHAPPPTPTRSPPSRQRALLLADSIRGALMLLVQIG